MTEATLIVGAFLAAATRLSAAGLLSRPASTFSAPLDWPLSRQVSRAQARAARKDAQAREKAAAAR